MKTLTLFFFFCHSLFSNNFTENLLNISSNNEDDNKTFKFVQILNTCRKSCKESFFKKRFLLKSKY